MLVRTAGGAVDGSVATLVMSGIMLAAGRAGLMGRMPPRKITEWLLRRFRPWTIPSRRTRWLSALAHLGFGAGAGALYGAGTIRGPARGARAVALGTAYGAAIWAVSYAGWVPALGIMPPPRRDRPGRPPVMFAAHLVYGAVLGWLTADPHR